MNWDEIVIFKELHFVYIVNGKVFLTEKEAKEYIKEKKDEENNIIAFYD
jgi:hypothetical protein